MKDARSWIPCGLAGCGPLEACDTVARIAPVHRLVAVRQPAAPDSFARFLWLGSWS